MHETSRSKWNRMKSECTFRQQEICREGERVARWSVVGSISKKKEGEWVICRKWRNVERWIKTVWMYGGGWRVVGHADFEIVLVTSTHHPPLFSLLLFFSFSVFTSTCIFFFFFELLTSTCINISFIFIFVVYVS